MFKAIAAFFKLALFFLNLNKEANEQKAKEKAELGKEVVDAIAETDPNKRASNLNVVIGRINRVCK